MAKKNKKFNGRRNVGWARTKEFPHKRHPAFYKRKGSDDIEYVTFTHSEKVVLDNEKILETEQLKNNIAKDKKDKNFSYVVKRVFVGKRSALGKESDDFKIKNNEDRDKVEKIFKTAPKTIVHKTGNRKK